MKFLIDSKKVKGSYVFSASDYLFAEHSFLNKEDSDASLMINHQYLSLDVSLKNNLITGISGYFNLSNCPEKSLEYIVGESGRVEVTSCSFALESGIGYSYPIVGQSFYDRKKQILQIGEVAHSQEKINISENIILGLFEREIACIQIKIHAAN